jgi:hypothetical protein
MINFPFKEVFSNLQNNKKDFLICGGYHSDLAV